MGRCEECMRDGVKKSLLRSGQFARSVRVVAVLWCALMWAPNVCHGESFGFLRGPMR